MRFDVAPSTMIKLVAISRCQAVLRPRGGAGYRKLTLAVHDEAVRELVPNMPDATLEEFVIELTKLGMTTSWSGLDRYFVSSTGV